jgi:hypothetical protein
MHAFKIAASRGDETERQTFNGVFQGPRLLMSQARTRVKSGLRLEVLEETSMPQNSLKASVPAGCRSGSDLI